MSKPLRVLCMVGLTCVGLAGCSLVGSLFGKGPSTTRLSSLAVIAEEGANSNSATAIDVLFIYDGGVFPLLPKDAPAWFMRREALTNTFGRAVEIVSLQVPASYRLAGVELPLKSHRAVRVWAYANYVAAAGQAPVDLTGYRHATVTLRADQIVCAGQ